MEFESYTWKDIEALTNNFSEKNFIGLLIYGKAYRGKTEDGKEVTVKIFVRVTWDFHYGDMAEAVKRELAFLDLQKDCPYFPKPIGYCSDCDKNGHLAVVYDLKPLNTLQNLLKQGSRFLDWNGTLYVAREFARSLAFMHKNQYYVRNMHAAHIMIDQRLRPFLIEFGALQGGLVGLQSDRSFVTFSDGYLDEFVASWDADKADVFGFGVVLISLLSKRVWESKMEGDDSYLFDWAHDEYARHEKNGGGLFSLVEGSMKSDLFFDDRIDDLVSRLALRCVTPFPNFRCRPTMDEVVSILDLVWELRGKDIHDLGAEFSRFLPVTSAEFIRPPKIDEGLFLFNPTVSAAVLPA